MLLLLPWQHMSETPKLCVSGQAVDVLQISPVAPLSTPLSMYIFVRLLFAACIV